MNASPIYSRNFDDASERGAVTDRKTYYLKNQGKINVQTYNIYDSYKIKNKHQIPTTDTEIDFFKKGMSWHEIKQKEQRMGMLVSERASMADINIKKIFPTSTVDNKEKLFLEKVRLLNKVDDDFEGIKIKRIDQRYQN